MTGVTQESQAVGQKVRGGQLGRSASWASLQELYGRGHTRHPWVLGGSGGLAATALGLAYLWEQGAQIEVHQGFLA